MASVQETDIVLSFQQIQKSIESDSGLLAKCVDLCTTFELDAGKLRDKWEAYADKIVFEGDPKLEHLDAIRSELAKQTNEKSKKNLQSSDHKNINAGRKEYTKSSLEKLQQGVNSRNFGIGNVRVKPENSHMPGTPQSYATPSKRKGADTPTSLGPLASRPRALPATPRDSILSPGQVADDSPDSAKFSNRENKFKPVSVFNEALSAAKPQAGHNKRCEVNVLRSVPDYRYMYEKVEVKCFALLDRLKNIVDGIIDNQNLKGLQTEDGSEFILSPVNMASQARIWCCGRICVDGDVGPLNPFSVALEGVNGRRVKLDLGAVQEYALFPGQIVIVEGINTTGSCLVAQSIYCDASLPPAQSSLLQLAEYNESEEYLNREPLSVVVAAGPYTTSADLTFKPLDDLLLHLRGIRPDVLILCGPFVDATHRLLDPSAAGTAGGFSNGDPPDTLELVHRVMRQHLISGLREIGGMQCVLIPHLNDLHSQSVYPQPAFDAEIIFPGPENQYNTTEALPILVSNPCTFRINEVVISVSSADVLLHLSGNEASRSTGDRLARLARHVIQQRCFYPLFPAAEGAQLSTANIHQLSLPITPDVLILPSQLNPFVKRGGEVLCINPGRLTKGASSGTFAHLSIHPIIRNIRTKSTRTSAVVPIASDPSSECDSAAKDDSKGSICQSTEPMESESVRPQQLSQKLEEAAQDKRSGEDSAMDNQLESNADRSIHASNDVKEDVQSVSDGVGINPKPEDSDTADSPKARDKATIGSSELLDKETMGSSEICDGKDLEADIEPDTSSQVAHRVVERTRVEIVRI